MKATKDPETRAMLENTGFQVTGTTSEQFTRTVKDDAVRWAKLVKATGFKQE